MNLAGRVVAFLRARDVLGAVIGGVALAVHGIARATIDLDLLVVTPRVLDASFWDGLGTDVVLSIRKGDANDPLAGVVRCVSGVTVVDVVVGASRWMDEAIDRAVVYEVAGEQLRVVDAADLVLLKLYAGGPQDLLDVRLFFASDPDLRAIVEARIGSMPPLIVAQFGDMGPVTPSEVKRTL